MSGLHSKYGDLDLPDDVNFTDFVFQGIDQNCQKVAIVSKARCILFVRE